eukprot:5464267-Prymnesium_polylepis.3
MALASRRIYRTPAAYFQPMRKRLHRLPSLPSQAYWAGAALPQRALRRVVGDAAAAPRVLRCVSPDLRSFGPLKHGGR